MKLKSLLWQPLVGETLRAGPVALGGVAWSDGREPCDTGRGVVRRRRELAERRFRHPRKSLRLVGVVADAALLPRRTRGLGTRHG